MVFFGTMAEVGNEKNPFGVMDLERVAVRTDLHQRCLSNYLQLTALSLL